MLIDPFETQSPDQQVPHSAFDEMNALRQYIGRFRIAPSGITNGNGSYEKRRFATLSFLPPPLIPLDETLEFEFFYSNATPPGIGSSPILMVGNIGN